MPIEESLQKTLRNAADDGATVADIVRLIRINTNMSEPGRGRLVVARYMSSTFGIPLPQVSEIGSWVGFEDGDGSTSDEELQEKFGSYLTDPS